MGGVYFAYMGRRNPLTDWAHFFSVKDIHDVITHAKFGDDRLRGSGVVAGQISAFPIDFAGRPYNTLTLPCERVTTLITCCCCRRSGLRIGNIYGTSTELSMTWMDGVSCSGNENALALCLHNAWGDTGWCTHDDDVTITCATNFTNTIGKLTRRHCATF